MSNFQNIIITISGEPASGKSSIIREMKKQYESMGYEVEIYSVGEEFRKLVMEEYAKYLNEHPEIPRKENPSLADAQSDKGFLPIIRNKLDTIQDNRTKEFGERINSKYTPNKVTIVDARLGCKWIPNSFAVRTVVDEVVAGQRVYRDTRRGPEDSYPDEQSAIHATKQRKDGEIQRYIERYGFDLTDIRHYKLVIDTTNLTTQECAKKIIEAERVYRERKMQREMDDDGR